MTTKIRTRPNATRTEILALVAHPMSGARSAQAVAPPHFIERMSFDFDGKTVAEVFMSPNVATNPLTIVAVNSVKSGASAAVRWIDSRGMTGSANCKTR